MVFVFVVVLVLILWGKRMEDVKNGSCLFPRFQISVATGD